MYKRENHGIEVYNFKNKEIMATVYKIDNVDLPKVKYTKDKKYDSEATQTDEDRFVEEIRNVILTQIAKGSIDKYAGEIIKFPTADSYAFYMIVSAKNASLVHLNIGDQWHFDYVHLLDTKSIIENLEQQKAMDKLFS